jgi:phosphate starvation-inducible protein PhoH
MKETNRIRKNEIKYNIQLTDEQKLVKEGVYEKDVTIILGAFGSGKTACGVLCALDLLFKKHIDTIYITRPIDFNATGYLKGSAEEKMSFHIFPIKQNMYAAYNKQKIDELFKEGAIQIVPIDYMKGMTFTNSCTIVDEFEDIDFNDFSLILTRLGKGSKLIFTGSEEQTDIKNSCIQKIRCLEKLDIVNYHTLKSQHRNDDITKILNFIAENNPK